ncbi:hypothetical protein EST38_g8056 [Candolleomyces aberdarensis]|uniref:Protein kinase domain-containing protein n=1 Tax=Candolleomyces aberdarensis TaxID=2316362 RepID=A0A4Q2DDK5_9AGAR|nr:hypothetical protein EST38_g8056 [Candolleomyces aberdarensis]
MAEKIPVFYFACAKDSVPGGCGALFIPLDEPVAHLHASVGRATSGVGNVRLWKPRAFLSRDRPEDLRGRLEDAGALNFGGFCDPLFTDENLQRTIADLFAGQAFRPSVSSKPLNYLEFQNGPVPILDGRYGTTPNPIALPVEVHHPAFAEFSAVARDSVREPPDDIIDLTIQLMATSSRIVTTELDRQSATRDLLSKILRFPVIEAVNRNRSSAYYAATYSRSGSDPIGAAALGIIEEKIDLGISGDPSTQGSFSYLQHWTDPAQKALMEATSCPSFIISIAGPWLVVLGAVLTSSAIVQRLTDFLWLGDSRLADDTHTLRLARIFTALRDAVARLQIFYETFSLPILATPPSECAAFLATTSGGKPVVVKFVERYGVEAHEKLAGMGKAPALLYHGDVWPGDEVASEGCSPRKMVVMEYIDGETCEDGVSDTVRLAVRNAVEYLHSQRIVHGDIRRPNIIIARGEGDEGSRVKILDFDWAGEEGKASSS